MEILSDPFILNNFITNCPVGGHQCLEDIKLEILDRSNILNYLQIMP